MCLSSWKFVVGSQSAIGQRERVPLSAVIVRAEAHAAARPASRVTCSEEFAAAAALNAILQREAAAMDELLAATEAKDAAR